MSYKHILNRVILEYKFHKKEKLGQFIYICNIHSRNQENKSDKGKGTSAFSNLKYVTFAFGVGLSFGFGLDWLRSPNKYFSTVKATKLIEGYRDRYNFIADVVENVANSVVNIEIQDTKRFNFFDGSPIPHSNGSGFIIASDGLILTNAHVVMSRPRSNLEVRLWDGSKYRGAVEFVDMERDLATIRIPRKGLPAMKLGSVKHLRPGEFVVAIGSPLSLSNTITAGVVSTTNRTSHELGLRHRDMEYIQTDAAITFGNSGGPLVNLDGEAVGINAMKVTAGISFAIPIDYAIDFLKKSYQRKGSTQHIEAVEPKYMGITMLTLTPDIIRELQVRSKQIPVDLKEGVLIWKVIVGSPAYVGGMQPGDIVTSINGNEVKGTTSIYEAIKSNDKLKIGVYRGLKKLDIHVVPETVKMPL